MSLNLGTPAIEAMRRLGMNSDWKHIREAVLEQARTKMNIALESQHGNPADACGYARALRDISVAFESATMGVRVKKPGLPGLRESQEQSYAS
jgi:hypothetical protein